jgi:hypothetical protein
MIKLLVISFICLGFIQPSYAETCITNSAELEAKKADFPNFLFERPPPKFTKGSYPASTLSFKVVNGKILGEAILKWGLGATSKANGYVTKLCCTNGSKLTVALEVGTSDDSDEKKFTVNVKNDNTINVDGDDFQKLTAARSAGVLNNPKKVQETDNTGGAK